MALLVQKYGGTSVGSPERIQAVARRVAEARRRGDDLVVVVSAMGDTTDDLIELAAAVTGEAEPGRRHPREMDMLLTAGERISMALVAMAIRQQGMEALSLTGSQAAIITDETHTAARILEVRAERVRTALRQGCVVIVAGFQGVSRTREVTTLGRGGSDTTAVALAVALNADRCEIYTDVPGVYTADPRRIPEARVIPVITAEEMLELATAGAQVLHARAVEIASKYGMDLWVKSSFEEPSDDTRGGTLITPTPRSMEEFVLTGITAQAGQAKLVLRGLPPGMGTSTAVLVALAEAGVSIDVISEARESNGRSQIQITLAEGELDVAVAVAGTLARELEGEGVEVQRGLTRIAMVGSGMHYQPGVYARAFRALLDQGIDVVAVSTSGITITVLVPSDRQHDAVAALHQAFELELMGAAEIRDRSVVAERQG